jgi:acetate kinase
LAFTGCPASFSSLAGLDTLIFTAGIGKNMPAIRGRICEHLEFLGFAYSPATSETPRSFPSRESGQRSRDDDQRRTDDRPAHRPSHAPSKGNYS